MKASLRALAVLPSLGMFGEYQDEEGQTACKRCPFGEYQDEKGQATCKACPASTTTLGLGGVTFTDCGCESGFINTATAAAPNCVSCLALSTFSPFFRWPER